jgi:hypothetical protein
MVTNEEIVDALTTLTRATVERRVEMGNWLAGVQVKGAVVRLRVVVALGNANADGLQKAVEQGTRDGLLPQQTTYDPPVQVRRPGGPVN